MFKSILIGSAIITVSILSIGCNSINVDNGNISYNYKPAKKYLDKEYKNISSKVKNVTAKNYNKVLENLKVKGE